MIEAVQIQLYPSPNQRKKLDEQINCHRELYNHCLNKKEELYNKNKINISYIDLIKSEIKIFRNKEIRFKNCNYSSLQQTIRRLEKAYQKFFKYCKDTKTTLKTGKPREKSYFRFNSIEFSKYGDGWRIKGDKLYIQNIGEIKGFWSKEILNPSRVIITRRFDKYFATFIIKSENQWDKQPIKNPISIGLDFGIKTFLTTSDGEKIESPKFLKQEEKELNKARSKRDKTKKGTIERKLRNKIIGKIESRIINKRKNFNHKLSRKLINKYDILCLEDIKLESLNSFIPINKRMRDIAFGQFRQFLSYKAERANKIVVKVNPAYTSQTCNRCGAIKSKEINERIHNCSCGYVEDRDINAAKNILGLGLQSLGLHPRSPRF